jgi:diguanylate cyclase (GGDEF)-like protein
LAAPLVLLAAAVRAARRTERERDRLQSVLDATSRIQLADDPDVQEAALVDAARELLLWKDVEVRTLPPGEGEIGGRLPMREGVDRWLVSRPRVDSDPWTTDDEMVIEALTNAASAALERARLQQEMGRLALIDPLTGVANRRHMDEALASLLNPTHRRQFALLVLDLDDFKSINDDLGHEAGDRVLQIVAERLRRSVRADDLVARLGGDEFVVVLPAVASRSVVRAIIDTIRSRVAQPVGIGDDTIAVTVSVGYAIAPVEGSTAVDLMRAADRRMYKSKSSTRGAAQLPTPREGVELLLP